MIAFGGAGPLHAVAIAREIFIPKVIIPKVPGTFSALGMLMASWRQDFVRTLYRPARLARRQAGRGACSPNWPRPARPSSRATASRQAPPISPSRRSALCRPGAHHRHSGARPEAADRRLRAAARSCSTPSTTSATARPRPTSGWRSSTCASSSPRRAQDTLAERWLSEPWTPEPPVAEQWRDVDLRRSGASRSARASSGGRRSPPARGRRPRRDRGAERHHVHPSGRRRDRVTTPAISIIDCRQRDDPQRSPSDHRRGRAQRHRRLCRRDGERAVASPPTT